MSILERTTASVAPLDRGLAPRVTAHLDNLTKPRGSLGRLEELALQYCLVTGTARPVMRGKRIFTFAADHGVADEGVSAFPKAVTAQMVRNMLAGGAAVNVLARHAGADVCLVDIGVADPLEGADGLCRRKVMPGTHNMACGSAMSPEQARRAVEVGIDLATEAAADGVTLIGTGEMGIANTTAASALFAVLLDCPVEEITGRGTGIDDATLAHKVRVIKRALRVNRERLGDPLGALAAVGGLEIAGICGLALGAAACRVPVIVDGFISSAGALAAWRICPAVADYLIFSHLSAEAGHAEFVRRVGARPLLDLGMRLGEGTGAALAMCIVEAAVKAYNEMATFGSAGVSDGGA